MSLQFLVFLNCARTGVVSGKCFDDHFWYSPSCRDVPQNCLVWFTAGNGWGMGEMLVKATIFNMPVALVVASSLATYASVPNDLTNLMLYWWVPDPTFWGLQVLPKWHVTRFCDDSRVLSGNASNSIILSWHLSYSHRSADDNRPHRSGCSLRHLAQIVWSLPFRSFLKRQSDASESLAPLAARVKVFQANPQTQFEPSLSLCRSNLLPMPSNHI